MGTDPLLILGASGFLGAHLVARAEAAGLPVVAVARRPELRPGRAAGADGAVRELAFDLAVPGALEELLADVWPSAVICAAALSRIADCERAPEAAQRLNAEVPGSLAGLCRKTGVRLVHVSTDLVFGGAPARRAGGLYDEEDSPAPLSVYGASKAAGERAVLDAGGDALVVRLPLLYGDSGGRGLGASDQVLAALARGERPFLFTDEHRTPLDVADAAAALLELAVRSECGILHVAGPERLDRCAFGLSVLAARGFSDQAARAALDAGPRAPRGAGGRPADVSLDAARARALLATPLRAPRDALRPGAA